MRAGGSRTITQTMVTGIRVGEIKILKTGTKIQKNDNGVKVWDNAQRSHLTHDIPDRNQNRWNDNSNRA